MLVNGWWPGLSPSVAHHRASQDNAGHERLYGGIFTFSSGSGSATMPRIRGGSCAVGVLQDRRSNDNHDFSYEMSTFPIGNEKFRNVWRYLWMSITISSVRLPINMESPKLNHSFLYFGYPMSASWSTAKTGLHASWGYLLMRKLSEIAPFLCRTIAHVKFAWDPFRNKWLVLNKYFFPGQVLTSGTNPHFPDSSQFRNPELFEYHIKDWNFVLLNFLDWCH
jgi:hypothetical protein